MKRLFFLVLLFIHSAIFQANTQESNDKDLCVASTEIENAQACHNYGKKIDQDKSDPNNGRIALSYFIRACELGLDGSCTISGFILYHGLNNIEKDWKTALPMMARACDGGVYDNSSCYLSARIIFEDTVMKMDINDGIYLADKGCSGGDAKSCRLLAKAFLNGEYGFTTDIRRAIPFAIKACQLKDSWGCFNAGARLASGKNGIKRSGQDALKLLDRACSLGEYAGCHNAGIEVSSGNELGNDIERSSDYFALACNNGIDVSCYSAGHLKILLEKYDEALPFLSKICDQEQKGEACRMAGMAVVELQGPSASRSWYQKGCNSGDQQSCNYINDLNRYEREQAENEREYAAQIADREAGSARVTQALNSGNYDQAMEIATYDIGSRADVSRVVLAANGAGTLSQIDPFYFTFLGTWLSVDYQQANTIVRREFLKNPDGVRPTNSRYSQAATINDAPSGPSLSDQFWKNQKDTYRRQLDWANSGGNPAGFSVKRN